MPTIKAWFLKKNNTISYVGSGGNWEVTYTVKNENSSTIYFADGMLNDNTYTRSISGYAITNFTFNTPAAITGYSRIWRISTVTVHWWRYDAGRVYERWDWEDSSLNTNGDYNNLGVYRLRDVNDNNNYLNKILNKNYNDNSLVSIWLADLWKLEIFFYIYSETANTITITYNANGGDGTISNTVITYPNSGNFASSGFTKTGYTLAGWDSTSPYETVEYSLGYSITFTEGLSQIIDVYAIWTIQTYNVSFVVGDGATAVTYQSTVTYNSSYTLPSASTKTGYYHTQWKLKDSNGNLIHGWDVGSTFNPWPWNSGATFYPNWTAKTYTVKFTYANGGSFTDKTATYDSSFTLYDVTPPTGKYVRWYTNDQGTGTNYTPNTFFTWKLDVSLYTFYGTSYTFYGIETLKTINITYSLNGYTFDSPAAAPSGTSVTYGASFTAPALNKSGYNCSWNTKTDNTGTNYIPDFEVKWNTESDTNDSSDNITLYAIQTVIVYKIEYYSTTSTSTSIGFNQASTGSISLKPSSDFTSTQLNIPSGRVFAKWLVFSSDDASISGNTQYNSGQLVKQSITNNGLIKVKSLAGYTISYNLNGASGTVPSSSNVPANESYNGFPSITSSKRGYRANGWNTSSSAQEGLTSIIVDSNKTLYAVWASNIFKIIYYANNGTTGSSSWTSNNIGYPNPVNFRNNDNIGGITGTNFPAPTNSGKKFIRWSTDARERQGTRFNPSSSFTGWINSSNLTVYAKWGYTVQYQQNPNEPYKTATGPLPPSSNEESGTIIGNGGLLYAPINLSLTGYKINNDNNTCGWNSNKDATSSLSTISSLNEHLTLYPIWKADSYTINYNANGGSGNPYNDMILYGNNIVIKSSNQVSITPPSGRVFVRWSTESQERQGIKYNVGDSETWSTPSTRTLYAKWGYKVIYNSNNGDGNLPIYDVEEPGCNIRISRNTSGIKKLGYTIASGSGWNTNSSGNTSITDITIPASTDITLYIVWNPNIYRVNFDQNFGTNTTISRSATYPNTLTFLGSADPIKRTGYTLKSWNSSRDGTGITSNLNKIINSGSEIGQWNLNTNTTVYAQWEDNYDGKFLEVIVNKGGSGYTPSSTSLNINNAGAGRGARFTPIIIDGIIRSVVINNAGSNYSLSSSISITDTGTPAGSGAELIPYVGKNTTLQMIDIKTRLPTIETTVSTTLNKYYNTTNTATSNIINNSSVALISPIINQSGQITNVTITHSGAGYISTPTISFANQGPGTGAQFNITIELGSISYIYIIDGGEGYISVPSLTATGGGATTQALVTATISGGKITGITINNRGSGYTSSPTITVTGGGSPTKSAEIIAFINGITNIIVTNSGTNYAQSTTLIVSQPPINMITFKGY